MYVCDYDDTRDTLLYCNCSTLDVTEVDAANFLNWLESQHGVIYARDLRYVAEKIYPELERKKYIFSKEKKLECKQYNALILDSLDYYCVKICFENGQNKKKKKQIELHDLSKISPMPKNNITECARMAAFLEEVGFRGLTAGGSALTRFKAATPHFKTFFPSFSADVEKTLRKSLRGGVCQLNTKYKDIYISRPVYIYDANSAYSYQAATRILPYGLPKEYSGEYTYDPDYPLYLANIRFAGRIKRGYVPTLLDNENNFHGNNYITDTNYQYMDIWLTSIDLQLLIEHYVIYDIQYLGGFKFCATNNLFRSFILDLFEEKINSKTPYERAFAKNQLNAFLGKFCKKSTIITRKPYISHSETLYATLPPETTFCGYLPVYIFVTAYARQNLLNLIQRNYKNFIYCDTDSIHLTAPAKEITLDNTALGCYKQEYVNNTGATYHGPKFYEVHLENETIVKHAGHKAQDDNTQRTQDTLRQI